MASGRSAVAHDAIRALDRIVHRGEVSWILEADIVSFFDSLDRTKLKEMLQIRVADGSLLRLIGKCLHVGVLDGAELSTPETGTAQGSVLSPMLGNVYLHYVLDLWFEREVKPRLRGRATLIRYADDFVIGFRTGGRRGARDGGSREADGALRTDPAPGQDAPACPSGVRRRADRAAKVRPPSTSSGFTLYWGRTRSGRWGMLCKTRSARLRRAIQSVDDWCRRHRHLPVKAQHAALTRRIRGHFNYFGVSGNFRSLLLLVEAGEAVLVQVAPPSEPTRAPQLGEVRRICSDFPLPRPRITVRIWGP